MVWQRTGKIMANFMDRYGKSLAFSIGLHFVGAVILGLVSYQIQRTPPNIMEVTLAGGGGGGAAAATTVDNTTAPVATDKDAVVDKKLKPKEPKPQQSQQVTKNTGSTANNSTGNGTGVGSGTGTGTGSGNGSGNGSGSGSGVGSGSGSGIESPTVPPRLLSKTNPRYPLGARSRNITGTTSVRMLVNEKGRVESASVANSSGNGELDASAVECVYKWKFSPAKNKQGNAVQCYITIPIKFTIN